MDDSFEGFESSDAVEEFESSDAVEGFESSDAVEGFESGDADWRDAYRTVLDAGLPATVAVEGSRATVPRGSALAALAGGDDRSAGRAEALLADLDAGGVVARSGDAVAVLFDPVAEETGGDPSLTAERWRVATDALGDELERLVAEANAEKNRAAEREIAAELDARAEALRGLGSGDGVPDPETLSDEEYERFRELREEFTHYKRLQEASADPPPALHADVASLSWNLPDGADHPLAAFGRLVDAAAGLQAAVERGDGVDDSLGRLRNLLDEHAE